MEQISIPNDIWNGKDILIPSFYPISALSIVSVQIK